LTKKQTMRKIILILILFSVIFLTGCNKDAQVVDFMKDFEKTTTSISEKFDEGDIDAAKKILDEEKTNLRREWQYINGIWSFQASDQVKKRMEEEPVDNMKKVVKSANKAINKYPNENPKIQAILTELTGIIK
jgi:hypothetical protein